MRAIMIDMESCDNKYLVRIFMKCLLLLFTHCNVEIEVNLGAIIIMQNRFMIHLWQSIFFLLFLF